MKYELPDPAEWDFRSITAEQLDSAIEYEYARESKKVRSLIREYQIEKPEFDFTEACIFADECPEFPRAYVTLNPRPILFGGPKPAICIKAIEHGMRPSWGWKYALNVPFGEIDIKTAVKQFEDWIRNEAKKFPRKKAGNGSVAPWAKLKWLAAKRLSAIPLDELKNALKDYKKKHPVESHGDVLPDNFQSNFKAIRSAEKFAKEIEDKIVLDAPAQCGNPPSAIESMHK